MRQFKPYPIYINYSDPKDEERIEDDFWAQGDYKMALWMQNTGRRLVETIPSGASRAALAYEEATEWVLKKICHVPIGKLVFQAMKSDIKIWIVPFHDDDQQACRCVAATSPGVYTQKQGGGVRLFFDPSGLDDGGQSYTPDDVLFHEIVHAYRVGSVGAGGPKWTAMRDYRRAEEFLAVHFQNVYLDNLGKRRYYPSLLDTALKTKGHIYEEFTGDVEVLMALNYFLNHEPLAAAVARWTFPDFNPWRDFPTLLNIWKDSDSDQMRINLPEL